MTIEAYEFRADDDAVVSTGRVEYYSAESYHDGLASVLYTHRLHDAHARIGASGRTVVCGRLSYSVQVAQS